MPTVTLANPTHRTVQTDNSIHKSIWLLFAVWNHYSAQEFSKNRWVPYQLVLRADDWHFSPLQGSGRTRQMTAQYHESDSADTQHRVVRVLERWTYISRTCSKQVQYFSWSCQAQSNQLLPLLMGWELSFWIRVEPNCACLMSYKSD